MKRLLLLLLIPFLLGANIDIDPEERPALTETKIDTVKITPFTKTAQVNIRRGYIEGNDVVWIKERNFIFMDRVDNPLTPDNEFSDDYTQFMVTIDVDMPALRQLIKSKW